MKNKVPAEVQDEYKRFINAVADAAVKEQPSKQVYGSVLLKLLVSEVIHDFGFEKGLERLSMAINECVQDMKAFGISDDPK